MFRFSWYCELCILNIRNRTLTGNTKSLFKNLVLILQNQISRVDIFHEYLTAFCLRGDENDIHILYYRFM